MREVMRPVLRRALDGVLVLALVGVGSFGLLELAPGDYLDEMRMNPQVSPETVAALRALYGLDRPLLGRYASWLGALAGGDWGLSFAYNAPVRPLVLQRAANTLLLSVTAFALSWALALPLGVWWATRRPQSWADATGRAGMLALVSMPEMLVAIGLLWLAVKTGDFPVGGLSRLDVAEGGWARLRDVAWHLVLPMLALVLGAVGGLIRHVRAGVAEVLAAPFVRALRAGGMPEGRLLWRYVLPTAANPLITLFGFSVGALLSASLVVEVVMGWPGLGPLLLEAILGRDVFVVVGCVLVAAVFVVAGNALADVLLYLSDPRLRVEAPA